MSRNIIFCLLLIVSFVFSVQVFAHGGGQFSAAIIDSLKVHHAHIENEQKITFSYLDNFRNENGKKRSAFQGEIELAIVWDKNSRWGSEILIPYSNTGTNKDEKGVGDITLQAIKYAFINKHDTILTGILAFGLPTGNEDKGLGEGKTEVELALFLDKAWGNWYFGFNAEYAKTRTGVDESEGELAFALAYSFLKNPNGGSRSNTSQRIVPSISFEMVYEKVLSGEDKGETVASVVPGFHFWFPRSGWALRFGVEVPVSGDKAFDRRFVFQIGNHRPWRRR